MNKYATMELLAMFVVGAAGSCQEPSSSRLPSQIEPVTPEFVGANPGLHNVYRLCDGILSGSEPQGDAGFESLARMGVRTIVSVDGTHPDIERARARGMRYVHVPIGYDGIAHDKQIQLAKAIRDLAGPVYVHCHHGKHRGVAAAALAAVSLGRMNRDKALGFMRRAGTSPSYDGLYSYVEKHRY